MNNVKYTNNATSPSELIGSMSKQKQCTDNIKLRWSKFLTSKAEWKKCIFTLIDYDLFALRCPITTCKHQKLSCLFWAYAESSDSTGNSKLSKQTMKKITLILICNSSLNLLKKGVFVLFLNCLFQLTSTSTVFWKSIWCIHFWAMGSIITLRIKDRNEWDECKDVCVIKIPSRAVSHIRNYTECLQGV